MDVKGKSKEIAGTSKSDEPFLSVCTVLLINLKVLRSACFCIFPEKKYFHNQSLRVAGLSLILLYGFTVIEGISVLTTNIVANTLIFCSNLSNTLDMIFVFICCVGKLTIYWPFCLVK